MWQWHMGARPAQGECPPKPPTAKGKLCNTEPQQAKVCGLLAMLLQKETTPRVPEGWKGAQRGNSAPTGTKSQLAARFVS